MGVDVLAIMPFVILALGGVSVFCLGALWRACPSSLLWSLALALAAAAGLVELWIPSGTGGLSGMIEPGGSGRYFSLILCAIAAVSILFLNQYAPQRGFGGDELYGVLLLAALGMILVAAANNWAVFFIGFELLSVSLYILIAIYRGEAAAGEAGLKYFIMGAVASGFLVFGLALLYGATGTLLIDQGWVRLDPAELPLALLAFGFILAGLAFKLSIVPFHLWTPDVYQGAPAPVTAFLSTGSKVAVFGILTRILLETPASVWNVLVPALWILSALTMAVGNIAALRSYSLKRRLAFSSAAQMGYLLMALVAVKQEGPAAILFYLPIYAVMDLGAFGILGSFSAGGKDRDHLSDYRGLGFTNPWRTGVMALCLLSLAGLPPTAGFIGKFLILKSVLAGGHPLLALIGILTMIVSVYYYAEVVVFLYMQPEKETVSVAAPHFWDRVAWGMVLVLTLGWGLAPSSLISYINRMSW